MYLLRMRKWQRQFSPFVSQWIWGCCYFWSRCSPDKNFCSFTRIGSELCDFSETSLLTRFLFFALFAFLPLMFPLSLIPWRLASIHFSHLCFSYFDGLGGISSPLRSTHHIFLYLFTDLCFFVRTTRLQKLPYKSLAAALSWCFLSSRLLGKVQIR